MDEEIISGRYFLLFDDIFFLSLVRRRRKAGGEEGDGERKHQIGNGIIGG